MQAKYNKGLVELVGAVLVGCSAVAAHADDLPDSGVVSTNSPVLTNVVVVKSPWTATIAAGMTLTKGNTDTLIASVLGEGVRKSGPNEFRLGTDLAYGENSGVKNTELYRGYSQYDRMFTDRFYSSARVEAMRDGIADIKYRVILSPGVGCYLLKNTNGYLRAEAGPGYIFERRGEEVQRYATMRADERGEYAFSKTARGWETVEVLPQIDNFQNVIVNAEIGMEVAINSRWSLRSCIQDSFNNLPAKGRDQNDVKLITGIAYKLK